MDRHTIFINIARTRNLSSFDLVITDFGDIMVFVSQLFFFLKGYRLPPTEVKQKMQGAFHIFNLNMIIKTKINSTCILPYFNAIQYSEVIAAEYWEILSRGTLVQDVSTKYFFAPLRETIKYFC